MAAISLHPKDKATGAGPFAEIERDECVECGACFRAQVCHEAAIHEESLAWPRILRKAFSDPVYVHKGTDIPGRGTEEMKTNDVTGRFKEGELGVGLEFGRPGVGARLGETEGAIKRFIQMGLRLEPLNPLTQLIADPATGDLQPEVKGEKVLSAIVEGVAPLTQAQEVLAAVREIAAQVDTVITLDLISRVEPDGSAPAGALLAKAGLFRAPNVKTNVGLGRPSWRPGR
jgi:ferredoxin